MSSMFQDIELNENRKQSMRDILLRRRGPGIRPRLTVFFPNFNYFVGCKLQSYFPIKKEGIGVIATILKKIGDVVSKKL